MERERRRTSGEKKKGNERRKFVEEVDGDEESGREKGERIRGAGENKTKIKEGDVKKNKKEREIGWAGLGSDSDSEDDLEAEFRKMPKFGLGENNER